METNRRNAIVAFAASATALAVPAAAVAGERPTDRTAWNAAFAAYLQAKEDDEASLPPWRALHDRCERSISAIPHVTLRPDPYSGRKIPVSTSDEAFVRYARKTVSDVDAGRSWMEPIPSLQDHLQLCRDTVAAADARMAEGKIVRDRLGIDAADEKIERVGEAFGNARDALMKMPAPDLAALNWKLQQLRDEDGDMESWTAKYVRQTFEDIARLLPEAG